MELDLVLADQSSNWRKTSLEIVSPFRRLHQDFPPAGAPDLPADGDRGTGSMCTQVDH